MMGKLSAEERPAMGQLANEVRAALEQALEAKGKELDVYKRQSLERVTGHGHILPANGYRQGLRPGLTLLPAAAACQQQEHHW